MGDNLLDVVGPPTAKRPKLNSPLSGSDGTGKHWNGKQGSLAWMVFQILHIQSLADLRKTTCGQSYCSVVRQPQNRVLPFSSSFENWFWCLASSPYPGLCQKKVSYYNCSRCISTRLFLSHFCSFATGTFMNTWAMLCMQTHGQQ